jgi:hypothetical protein
VGNSTSQERVSDQNDILLSQGHCSHIGVAIRIHCVLDLLTIQRFFSRSPRSEDTRGHHWLPIDQAISGQASIASERESPSVSLSLIRIVRIELAVFPVVSFTVTDTVYMPGSEYVCGA